MPLDLSDFEEVKTRAEEYYKTLGDIYCPYLKEKISFNAKGLEHMKFKRHGHARPREDQYMRFKCLRLVSEILSKSHTLQGYSESRMFERVKVHNRRDIVMLDVEYYEFIGILKGARIKIVVKKVGDGQKFFWSLVPYWKTDGTTNKRLLHSGVPEED